MRYSKLLIEEPSDKLPRDLLALDNKQCRLLTGILTGHCSGKAAYKNVWVSQKVLCAGYMSRRRNPPTIYFINAQLSIE
jgi:hypothetical protein